MAACKVLNPPSPGLTDADFALLGRCYISRDVALSARLRRVTSAEGAQLVGRSNSEDYAGIAIPYYWPGMAGCNAHRLCRDHPPISTKRGQPKKQAKYLSAPGWSNHLYWHPDTPASVPRDPAIPLYITEGQKKCLALWRLFRETGNESQPIGLNGVWGWSGKIGIEENSEGKRVQVKGAIPDVDRIDWQARQTFIVFDTNVSSNASVAAARNQLALELVSRGAIVQFIDLQPEDGVNGIDDYLGKHGAEAGLRVLENARPFDPSDKIAKLDNSDAGNEAVFEMFFGEEYRYNVTGRQWLRWNGVYWEPDTLNSIDRAMLAVANARLDAVAKAPDDERAAAMKQVLRLKNVRNRQAALESATSNPRFARRAEDFDQCDYLFACAGGVIDLRDGEFRPGRRGDMLTKASKVEWNPAASCQAWLKFLGEVFPGNPEMIAFLQRAVGYSLTGSTREEVFFILHGGGRNGKGTFLRVLSEVFGDYAGTAEFSTLLAGKENARAPRNDIASMAGKRLVAAQESREGARFDESLIKTLTGGDLITARFLHREFFTFKPTWKIWLATNHRPEIRGTDTGIWSRPRLIPFDVSFEGREDKTLKSRLLHPTNLSGVLNWAIEGCLLYQQDGELKYPEAVIRATAEYKSDSDLIGRWIEECCVVGEGFSAYARPLYQEFSKWASQSGEQGMTETAFGRRMADLGHRKGHTKRGAKYEGIGLSAMDMEG